MCTNIFKSVSGHLFAIFQASGVLVSLLLVTLVIRLCIRFQSLYVIRHVMSASFPIVYQLTLHDSSMQPKTPGYLDLPHSFLQGFHPNFMASRNVLLF